MEKTFAGALSKREFHTVLVALCFWQAGAAWKAAYAILSKTSRAGI
jgi:hypothetical protein